MPPNLIIFASGSGSNAENIAQYFKKSGNASIKRIYCNNPKAGVLLRAEKLQIPSRVFSREEWLNPDQLIKEMQEDQADMIILAGFLWLVPEKVIDAFPGRIINIHPALLPLFGGKGFYGEKVHLAVIASGTPISGISIHHVNKHFDEGEIIFQAACHVSKNDNAHSLAEKIHSLEHRYFPVVIEKLLSSIPSTR